MKVSAKFWFSELTAAVLIIVFTYTAFDKLIHLKHFIFYLRKISLFDFAPDLIAWGIILVESIIVLLLLYTPFRMYGLAASMIIMALFTIYIGYMILSYEKLPCSCGGIINKLSWKNHFILNMLLTMSAAVGFYIERTSVVHDYKRL